MEREISAEKESCNMWNFPKQLSVRLVSLMCKCVVCYVRMKCVETEQSDDTVSLRAYIGEVAASNLG
jgi:hypothetical protein